MSTCRPIRLQLEELEHRVVFSATLVKDIFPGSKSSYPGGGGIDPHFGLVENVNGVLFFSANDGVHGPELWKSDGTAAGTVLVKEIGPGSTGAFIQQFENVNGVLYFRASDGVHSTELWKSDGTAAGTVLVADGSGFQIPDYLTNVSGTLFFTANSAEGGELWKSNGTAGGTVLVKDMNPGRFANTEHLTNVNGTLYFMTTDNVNGYELWKSNGTASGTTLVKDINPGFSSAYPNSLTNVNGTLYFSANDGVNGTEIWKSDGTAGGTAMIKDVLPGSSGSDPFIIGVIGNTVYFAASDDTFIPKLWKTDGTEAGTIQLQAITPSFTSFANLNGVAYFEADDEFWKSDGTPAGTVKVADLAADSLTNVNGTLFFNAYTISRGAELWQSDGTTAGTIISQEIVPGQGDSSPRLLVNVGGKLFFNAGDTEHGTELWLGAPSAPDKAGAQVTSAVFIGLLPDSFQRVELTFNEPLDDTSFDTNDVTLSGPGGSFAPSFVIPLDESFTLFQVGFGTQSTAGTYTVTVGPDVRDVAGNQMNQNQNSTNGEAGDQFVGTGILGSFPSTITAVGGSDGSVRIADTANATVYTSVRPLDNGATPYKGLVSVALGDFNGDGAADLVVAAANPAGVAGLATSKGGKVFVYDGKTLAAGGLSLIHTFTPFANTSGPLGKTGAYINGLNIAVGDVNGDGSADLVAGTRGGTAAAGKLEYGRLIVVKAGAAADGSGDTIIGSSNQGLTPFGSGYQKGVIVTAGNADGVAGDEVAVTRGGPVVSTNPAVQQIKVKALQLKGTTLTELPLSADGSTAFAPFGTLTGAAKAISRDGRVAFVDADGDGKAELVFSALDPLTNSTNGQVRVGVFAIDTAASTAAATIKSTGADAGTYLTGSAVKDHAITHAAATGTQQNIALITESGSSGMIFLAPLTGTVQTGGLSLTILNGGIALAGI